VWQAGAEGSQRSRGGRKGASPEDRMSCPQDTSSGEDDSELGPDAHVGCRWRGIFETNPMRGVRQGSSCPARGRPRNRATTVTTPFGRSPTPRQVLTASWNRDGPAMATHCRTRPRSRSTVGSHEAPRSPVPGPGITRGPRSATATQGQGDFTSDRASTSCSLRRVRGSRHATTSVAGSRERMCLPGRGQGQEGQPPGPTPGHADWTNRRDQPTRASGAGQGQGGQRERPTTRIQPGVRHGPFGAPSAGPCRPANS
jgi:hypothetical protein